MVAALLASVAVAALPSQAGSTAGCRRGGYLEDAGKGWVAAHPRFAVGDQPVALLAAPAFDPNAIYASNGTTVMRSLDAGCSWTTVFTAASDLPVVPAAAQITALSVPSSANSSAFIYLGVTVVTAGVERLLIATSRDRGRSWTATEIANGPSPLGSVQEFTADPQVPQKAYAVVRVDAPGAARSAIYATEDAGATWSRRTTTAGAFDGRRISADPTRATGLFALLADRLVSSGDGGADFTSVAPPFGSAVRDFDVEVGAGGARLAAALTRRPWAAISGDAGKSWRGVPAPFPPQSIAVAPLQRLIAVADERHVSLVPAGRASRDASPPGGAPTDISVTAPTARGFSITGLRRGAVMRATYSLALLPKPPATTGPGVLTPITLLPPGEVTQFPATLSPVRLRLSLPRGTSQRVPYQLLLPRTPTPVDVMFLIDTTSSMQPVIDGLRQGLARIVDALDSAGLDAQFGVADFRDYPAPHGTGGDEDWPYRLDRRIGPANAQLRQAIADLEADGGTADGGQSSLTAAYQSATGRGDMSHRITYVPPGQQAGYRPGALRLAMLSTDTPPHYGGERVRTMYGRDVRNPGPGYGDVIRALRRHEVHQMGLAIKPDSGPNSMPALTRLAAASRTFAPFGGVDCDGNGLIDVLSGRPLVCVVGSEQVTATNLPANTPVKQPDAQVSAGGLAAAVVALANGFPDRQPVKVSVSQGGRFARVLTHVKRVVNVHADNELAYGVRFRCPAAAAQPVHRLTFVATSPLATLATSRVELHCTDVDQPPTASGTPPVAGLAAAAGAPAPPAQPIPNVNPNANPNPNPNPAPNANVNAAIAEQSEQQGQLALATADHGRAPAERLAMSRAVRDEYDAMFVVGAGVLLAGAVGVATQRRGQSAWRTANLHGGRRRRPLV